MSTGPTITTLLFEISSLKILHRCVAKPLLVSNRYPEFDSCSLREEQIDEGKPGFANQAESAKPLA